MSDTPYVGQNVKTFKSSPEFDGFSKVVIAVTEELEYTAGTDTGRTLTLVCPWGTQAMADNILADIAGYKYHPYSATGAFLDPSSEIGDGVTVNGVYSGIYAMDVNFGGECRADISAPAEEEIDHEYPYVSSQERSVTRRFSQVESEFKVQAGLISSKVSSTGGDAQSFGWELDEKSWKLKAKNKNVLLATENGVEIVGKISATSGTIGGFDILSDHLSYNGQTWKGTNSLGAYLGINGLQLGKNFRVDMQGNLYAASGEFSGSVRAANIKYGGDYGTLSGSAISAQSLGLSQLTSGVRTSLDYADTAGAFFNGTYSARKLVCQELSATSKLSGKKLYQNGYGFYMKSKTFKDGSGKNVTISYWSPNSSGG